MVDVADRDGESVGGISGFGCDFELEEARDHKLYLLLGGKAVADDSTLDAEGSVLGDGQAAVGSSEHGDAAHLAEFERALGVGREEDLFNGHDVRLPLLEKGGQLRVHLCETHGRVVLPGELNGTRAEIAQAWAAGRVGGFDHSVAGVLGAAVDAEDAHGYESNSITEGKICYDARPVTIKPVDETVSQPSVCTESSTDYRRLWGRALLAAALVVTTLHAQDGTPVVVTRSAETDAATLQPGVMNRMTVVLDAAHGGADTGARISAPGGSTLLEKDVTLALALKLQATLQARGFMVVMTRTGDAANKPATTDVSPVAMTADDRAGIANSARASACLLLHAAGSGHGVHLYTSELDGVADEGAVLSWQTAQKPWISLSAQLSRKIGQELQETGVPHISGRASVRPVDSLTCPAVIVELAPEGEDVNSVNDAEYQQRVAVGIAGALDAWARQVQPPPREPSTLGRPKSVEPGPGVQKTGVQKTGVQP